jgi:uncharacterized alpha-E superfamily protein
MMLARVAGALLAVGRDVERAGTWARLIEVGQGMMLEGGRANGSAGTAVWEPVVTVAHAGGAAVAEARNLVRFLALAPEGAVSVVGCARSARDRASTVREHLPADLWEAINEAYLDLGEWTGERLDHTGVYAFCRTARRASHLVQGVADQVMRRDAAWQLLRSGRFLERARAQAVLLRSVADRQATHPDPPAPPVIESRYWRGVLDASMAYEAFLELGSGIVAPDAVAAFLVRDAAFPRSIRFSLLQVRSALLGLMDHGAIPPAAPAVARIDDLVSWLDEAPPAGADLTTVLDAVPVTCDAIEAAIVDGRMSHRGRPTHDPVHAQAAHQTQN